MTLNRTTKENKDCMLQHFQLIEETRSKDKLHTPVQFKTAIDTLIVTTIKAFFMSITRVASSVFTIQIIEIRKTLKKNEITSFSFPSPFLRSQRTKTGGEFSRNLSKFFLSILLKLSTSQVVNPLTLEGCVTAALI